VEELTIDPFELVKAEEMVLGYSARWFAEPLRCLAVEAEFYTPLLNPSTGEPSDTFTLGGKIDVMCLDERTGEEVLTEHKTTSHDISDGAPYWAQTRMSSQLSTYMVGARSLGFNPTRIVYDVLGRPGQRPQEATPVELRKYTKPTKAEPVPRLYANQRETDETPEEFRLRIREVIAAEPEAFYKRANVVRLQYEELEAAKDVWYDAESMKLGWGMQRFPRNPDHCVMISHTCVFLGACSGYGDITDPFKFRRVENPHEELSESGRAHLRVLTNSEIKTFRGCRRLHHLRYDLGVRSIKTTEPQRSGTLVHRGLEGWWLGKKDGMDEYECLERAFEMIRMEPESRVFLSAN
jgi:hypothetical protein